MSLFKFELKKLLVNKRTLIILVVLFIAYAVTGFITCYFGFGSQSNYAVYKELADAYTGPIDAEQAAISLEISDATKVRYGNNEEALSEAGAADPVLKFNMDYADYARFVDEYYNGASTDATSNPYGVNVLRDKISSMEEIGDTSSFEYKETVEQLDAQIALGEPEFANTSIWDNLFDLWGGYMSLFLLFIPLAFIIAPVFSVEASTGMDNIVLSSMHGRKKIVTAKLAAVVITSLVSVLVYLVATFLANALALGSFTGATAALSSVTAFARTPFAMSVWQFAIVAAVWMLFMGVVFGIVTAFISSKMKNQMSSFGIALVILMFSMILNFFGSNVAALIRPLIDFGFASLFESVDIFSTFAVYNIFGISVPYWAAALGLMAILGGICTWAIYRFQKTRTAA
ncbi:membrane protein [Lacrimispora amygdalina]|uniref:Membrane protein n=1 Tax=Lacrimispora amygdalina TaxID=253257 RepID=A0ABQ5M0I2_9FIRM